MKQFLSLHDSTAPHQLAEQGLTLKQNPLAHQELGQGKTMGLLFFNPSLRTRLSTQKAAQSLGMQALPLDFGGQAWGIELSKGAVMNGNKAEHLIEAAGVLGRYCDIIGLRAFPSLDDCEADYSEQLIKQFAHYAQVPVVNLESATQHPLQALADLMTIKSHSNKTKPKVVLTWAPHPKQLPQAVPNSFAQWMLATGHDLTIAQPPGYELADTFSAGAKIEYDQKKALSGADFVYAKNWSSYQHYGQCPAVEEDWQLTEEKMALTDEGKFMHCLPVRRNVVVSDAVLDGPRSLVLEQAENRVYAAQAVLKNILTQL